MSRLVGLSIETITLHLANLRELLLDSRTLQKIGCMMLRCQQFRLKVVVMSCNFFSQRFPVENAVTPGNSGYHVHSADSAVPDELKKINESFQLFSVLCILQKKSLLLIFFCPGTTYNSPRSHVSLICPNFTSCFLACFRLECLPGCGWTGS